MWKIISIIFFKYFYRVYLHVEEISFIRPVTSERFHLFSEVLDLADYSFILYSFELSFLHECHVRYVFSNFYVI
jgi:hypothetical protein